MLSIHTILEHLILRVNIVKDSICVSLMRSREHHNLKIFVCFLETLHEIWSEVYPSTYCLFAWKVDLKDDIRVLSLDIVDAVD